MPPKRKAEDDEAMPPDRKIKVDDVFKSRIIKFVIGEDQVEYNVHEAVIVKLSDPLRELVTNGTAESVEGKVVWKHVEMDTFTQFLQFAYEHDYTIIESYDDPHEHWGLCTINEKFALVEANRYVLQTVLSEEFKAECLKEADEAGDGTFGDLEKQMERERSHSPEHYMSHVRLYLLAHQHAVLGLMSLSVRKIRNMLVNHPVGKDFFSVVWGLLETIWPRTGTGDELRTLLLNLILLCLGGAMLSDEAADVLRSTPEIAASLMLMPKPSHWDWVSIY
ncbi:hypothetical protein LY76DRAFT_638230 [Colletotrichum caudatum]|nr:hypothetical protein LY76DRAFT_638230 [Colletotrichum caudatum]